MKISKGHYVPRELITSEALHEAIFKIFAAAGFSDERPHFGKVGNIGYGDDGLGIWNGDGPSTIMWGIKGDSVDEPLTLQQLFTAENGLQWPTSAYRVVASDTGVWFDLSQLPPVVISGVYSGGTDARILAIRQPKEKEVKTIEDAVMALNGKLPDENEQGCFRALCAAIYYVEGDNGIRLGSFEEFESTAKRMGYISGYRWGVEYPTNGKRPDLPDDVEVSWSCSTTGVSGISRTSRLDWSVDADGDECYHVITNFKITDPRYKPADTSYLNQCKYSGVSDVDQLKVKCMHLIDDKPESNWHDRGELPPVGVECLCQAKKDVGRRSFCKVKIVGYGKTTVAMESLQNIINAKAGDLFVESFDDLEFRPIRTEREKVIDAAFDIAVSSGGIPVPAIEYTKELLGKLHDAKALVLPPKKSDTKD